MMTIDIDTISGVPLTGLLKTHAPDDVGDDQEAQAEREQGRRREENPHEPAVESIEHAVSPQADGEPMQGQAAGLPPKSQAAISPCSAPATCGRCPRTP